MLEYLHRLMTRDDGATMVEYGLMVLSLAVAAIGCYVGYTLYSGRREIPERLSEKYPNLHRWVANKYYVDELYNALFVKSLLRLNEFLARFDLKVIDGLVNLTAFVTKVGAFISGGFDRLFVDGAVNLVANMTQRGGAVLRRVQSGRIQVYLYYAVGGILLVMLYRLF